MEFFFFIILGIIAFGIFGDKKKQKAKLKPSSVLSPKQPRPILSPKWGMQSLQRAHENRQGENRQGENQQNENQQSDWENYEAAERSELAGLQEDSNFSTLYKISKERVERAQQHARKAAEAKLSYKGLPTTKGPSNSSESLQSFETTAKNKQASGAYVAKQPPLVRDMNLSRKLFLYGGRSNTFGERQTKSFGIKTILGMAGLAVIGLYMLGALGS